MPDYFVPIDTSGYSDYYRSLINQGILNQFVLSYVDKNRKELKSEYKDFKSYKKNFQAGEELMDNLIVYSENEGLAYNEEEYKMSEDLIIRLVKAYVARDLWEMQEFYRIFNEVDPIFNKAVEVAKSPELYNKKLEAYTGE